MQEDDMEATTSSISLKQHLFYALAARADAFIDVGPTTTQFEDAVRHRNAACRITTLRVGDVSISDALGVAGLNPAGRWLINVSAKADQVWDQCKVRPQIDDTGDVTLFADFNDQPSGRDALGAAINVLQSHGFACFAMSPEGAFIRINSAEDGVALHDRLGALNFVARPRNRVSNCVFVSHYYEGSGAELCLLELINELIRDHWVLCTVVNAHPSEFTKKYAQIGAALVFAPTPWWCGPLGETDYFFSMCRASLEVLTPLVQRLQPDAIVSQTLVNPVGALVAAETATPHLWSVTEFGDVDHDIPFLTPFNRILSAIYDSSKKIVTISHAVRRALFPLDPDHKVSVIHTNVTIDAALTRTENAAKITAATLREGFNIAAVGTLLQSKGQQDAIRAVAMLLRRGKPTHLHLFGVGADHDYFNDLAARLGVGGHVTFWGNVPNPLPFLAQMDVLVSCARSEAFGRSCVEAMRLRRPVIFANAGGPAEYLDPEETALAYRHGDVLGLTDALERLVDGEDLRSRLGAAAGARAETLFTADRFGGAMFRTLTAMRCEGVLSPAQPKTDASDILERAGLLGYALAQVAPPA